MASPTKGIQKAAHSITGSSNSTGADKSKTSGRLFFLDAGGGRVFSANADGSDLKTIISEGRKFPDGLVVDAAAGHIYWTNMGNPVVNDGSIERADFDGSNTTNIIRPGGTFTPKQLQLDEKNRKLYWCDREGMRVMRANLDGSNIETLVDTSGGDARPGKDEKEVVRRHRGPGLRWGVMGPTLQWHLGGGANGIQHFLDHLMDPLAGLMKALGTPDVTPELKKTIAEGVSQMAGNHSVEQLAQGENTLLVDIIKLRAQQAKVLTAQAHA